MSLYAITDVAPWRLESRVLSLKLKQSYLEAKTKDPIIRPLFAGHYWEMGVAAYPKYKTLSNELIHRAKDLGFSGVKYVAGPAVMFLSRVLGWRFVRMLSYLKHGY